MKRAENDNRENEASWAQKCTPGAKEARGSFLERPGNFTGPKSHFEMKVSRKIGCVLTSNKVKSLTGQRHDRVQTESQQLQPWTAVSTLLGLVSTA